MFQENEIVHGLVSFGVLIFIIIYWKELSGIQYFRILAVAFLFLLASAVFTLLEDLSASWYQPFNFLEHSCDLLRTLAVLLWAAMLVLPGKSR